MSGVEVVTFFVGVVLGLVGITLVGAAVVSLLRGAVLYHPPTPFDRSQEVNRHGHELYNAQRPVVAKVRFARRRTVSHPPRDSKE